MLSPSSVIVWRPIDWSFFSRMFAIEDLPEPERPVNQINLGCCDFCSARLCFVTSIDCQWILSALRNAKSINPIPTVLLVILSTTTNPPITGSSSYGSYATLEDREILQIPISFISSDLAGNSSKVFTSNLCFRRPSVIGVV